MGKTIFTIGDEKKTLTIERVFTAPKTKLWQAYTNAEALEQWWGPKGWETEVKEFDFSEGGEWLYVMKCVDKNQGEWFGKESWGKAVYRNINPEASIEYTDYFCTEDGKVNHEMPSSDTTLRLIENKDGSTTLILETTYETAEALQQVLEMGMREGFEMTLDKLEQFVAE